MNKNKLIIPTILALALTACGGSDIDVSATDTEAASTPTATEAPATDAPTTTEAPTTTAAPTTEAPTTTEGPCRPEGRHKFIDGVESVCEGGEYVVYVAPTTTEHVLSVDDFTIELIVLEDQCFNSAGGLVTVEPELSIVGGEIDGEATLVYEIHGGENVETYNMDIEGTSYSYNSEVISTLTCGATLTAIPVRLIER